MGTYVQLTFETLAYLFRLCTASKATEELIAECLQN